MLLELVSRDELGRCLGIEAGAGPLPVTARSLTRAELRARERRGLAWLIGVYLLFGTVCLAVLLLAETSPTIAGWLPFAFAVAGGALLLCAWLVLRRHRAYRDPALAVEVGEDAVTVTGPAGTVAEPYRELVVARVLTRTPRNSVYFEGIELETKLGRIALGNAGFAGGNAAAGAILRRLDALDLPPCRTA